jgi:maltooligosyltrehalose trehalohydrolase
MHEFAVWAPAADRVGLELADGVRKLEPADGGWWRLRVDQAGHGTDYAYRLDGGEPRPDPRSPWQPEGVHGPSRVFDAGLFEWSDAGWTGRAVGSSLFYELHIGTFTDAGTFDAAIERLGYLVDLGVEMVSLLPVAAFPGVSGWGYDGVDLYAVHEPYGGPDGLQRFVDACHTAGIGVCLDVVYNHLGPSGNYLAEFGPYFTERHHTPWGPAVNLDDAGSAEVRRWICDNALRWFGEFHLDALRLDAVHALLDESPVHLLAQMSDEVAALSSELGRPLGLVAESDLNDPRMIEPVAEGGLGMTAQWSDDFHHALHALLTGERNGYYVDFGTPAVLAKTLTRVFLHDGTFSTFRGSDWGRPVDPATHRGHSFLAYTSNHDQVGNRALGDRPAAILTPGQLAIGAALTLCSPFTPMLFMGEEWAASTPWRYFTDHPDPVLADAVRSGRRHEFDGYGWDTDDIPDPQDPATRDVSVLDWTEPDRVPHRAILDWYAALIRLRAAEPDLTDDHLDRVHADYTDDLFVVRRGSITIAANLSADPVHFPLPGLLLETFGTVGGDTLGPHATAIVRKDVARRR